MIFGFFRRLLRDDNPEQIRRSLAHIEDLLEHILQEQQRSSQNERERIDPGFLALIWSSIAVALALFMEAAGKLSPGGFLNISSVEQGVWLVLTLTAFLFSLGSTYVAVRLTVRYAKSKTGPEHKLFAWLLSLGIFLLAAGIVVMAYFK